MAKISTEKKTLQRMIELYCVKNHASGDELCKDCSNLIDYAFKRLEHCPFGDNKGTCGRCRIHCYQPQFRNQIKSVMRFSGPRMVFYAPIHTIRHLMDALS